MSTENEDEAVVQPRPAEVYLLWREADEYDGGSLVGAFTSEGRARSFGLAWLAKHTKPGRAPRLRQVQCQLDPTVDSLSAAVVDCRRAPGS